MFSNMLILVKKVILVFSDLQITTGNIEVRYVNGNHVTMLDSDKVLAAINSEQIENVIATE